MLKKVLKWPRGRDRPIILGTPHKDFNTNGSGLAGPGALGAHSGTKSPPGCGANLEAEKCKNMHVQFIFSRIWEARKYLAP